MTQNPTRKYGEKSIPVAYKFVDQLPTELEEIVIYIVKDNFAAHYCLCGCRKRIVMPLCKHGWQITEKHGMISFLPIIENQQFPCKTNYRITNNVAYFINAN